MASDEWREAGHSSLAGDAQRRYLRAKVAYDGTDFHGFQVQVSGAKRIGPSASVRPIRPIRTVQGELETALATITQEFVRVIGAGRTDTGVHACGQVIAFGVRWRHSVPELQRALNAVLPADVALWSLSEAEEGFHPRFDACSRTYRYTIWNSPVRNPLLRRSSLWCSDGLDLAAMAQATGLIVGEHDFATFGSPPGKGNAIRRVIRACWTRDGERLALDIEADAFLYHMVRSIVGTLLLVGRGALSVEQFASLFAAAERSGAGPTAPAHGLCLMAVHYQGVHDEYEDADACCQSR